VIFISSCTSGGGSSAVPAPGFAGIVDEAIVNGDDEDSSLTAEVKEFDMVARRWNFQPDTIRVNQGDRVILNIRSVDVMHGFAINKFRVNSRLIPGQTTTVEFVADKKGTFTFFCSVLCGSGHSTMRGQLIVN